MRELQGKGAVRQGSRPEFLRRESDGGENKDAKETAHSGIGN